MNTVPSIARLALLFLSSRCRVHYAAASRVLEQTDAQLSKYTLMLETRCHQVFIMHPLRSQMRARLFASPTEVCRQILAVACIRSAGGEGTLLYLPAPFKDETRRLKNRISARSGINFLGDQLRVEAANFLAGPEFASPFFG